MKPGRLFSEISAAFLTAVTMQGECKICGIVTNGNMVYSLVNGTSFADAEA
jgi:hypothetical protein